MKFDFIISFFFYQQISFMRNMQTRFKSIKYLYITKWFNLNDGDGWYNVRKRPLEHCEFQIKCD